MQQQMSNKSWMSIEFLTNVGIVMLSAFLLFEVSDYPDMARTFPRLVLIMIIFVALLDSLLNVLSRQGPHSLESKSPVEEGPKTLTFKVYYTLFLMVLFLACLLFFGLIAGVAVFVFFSARTLGYKRPRILLPSSILISGFVYVIFSVIMKSLLPKGIIIELLFG
ncbi:MAG: tripartite tricarboxylate transporter TctB family protein [Deltaproteobacteria bacterium]|nr:tripartite tricarboxylate transporter TctB family protein [Deltaproteobacteria bacterium]